MTLLLAQIWPYLLGLAGLLAGYFAARQSGKAAARAEAQAQAAKATIEGMKNAREARDEIDALDDASVRARARARMRQRTGG